MIRITPATTVVCLAISRACRKALTTDITLTLWRAGCWPQHKTVCEEVVDDCGCRTVSRRVEIWPVRVQYKATHVNESGMACFTLDSKFLSLSGGRYDGKVETPCGKADLKFYKDGPLRVNGHAIVEDACVPICGPVDDCVPSLGVAGCAVPVVDPPAVFDGTFSFRCVDPDTFSTCDGFVEAILSDASTTETYEILWLAIAPNLIGTFTHTSGSTTRFSTLLSILSGVLDPAAPAIPTTLQLRRQSDQQIVATTQVLRCCQ